MKNILKTFVIMFLAAVVIAFTETRIITGKATNDRGITLSGVMVKVKGAPTGTITDLKGNYKISVSQEDRVLVFSLSGYISVERKIGEGTVINVIMKPEIVVVEDQIQVEFESKKDYASKAAPAVAGVAYESRAYFQRYNNNFNTEGYASVNENGYKNVKNNPLSTFSIDVDNASYSNIRRFINSGSLPPADAVRIEEMINYFKYDYPEPRGEHPFSIYTELAICPWNTKHQLTSGWIAWEEYRQGLTSTLKPGFPYRCVRLDEFP